mmetsp:Transcript_2075/g.7576  ORF Transcript_2075/g.7576 Transcript_2075/m.7576 type:complete len:247 (-) Transcript_2075:627-1367(-)
MSCSLSSAPLPSAGRSVATLSTASANCANIVVPSSFVKNAFSRVHATRRVSSVRSAAAPLSAAKTGRKLAMARRSSTRLERSLVAWSMDDGRHPFWRAMMSSMTPMRVVRTSTSSWCRMSTKSNDSGVTPPLTKSSAFERKSSRASFAPSRMSDTSCSRLRSAISSDSRSASGTKSSSISLSAAMTRPISLCRAPSVSEFMDASSRCRLSLICTMWYCASAMLAADMAAADIIPARAGASVAFSSI